MNSTLTLVKSWRLSPKEQKVRGEQDKQVFEKAILGSIILHIIVLYLMFPESNPRVFVSGRNPYINIRRYIPPKQQIPKQTAVEEIKKKVLKPIPDPTPDEPEVYNIENFEPVFDPLSEDDLLVFGMPDRPPGPAGPIALSQVERPPIPLYQPEPNYSELAKQARIEGKVILRIVVNKKGNVSDIKIMKSMGNSGLDESAIESVKQWRFKPGYSNNEPVDVYIDVSINFHLE
ncbi:MAG: hypothetical protein A2161_09485 [Candidatus Schekmanbacteria bacterium RBG_13_48_7]|uniref:TonB C-terminal domain-containing protein n=1 Tax=Candidatus Schekmanbacteria bacterium RBG_13_48_7 TaxID=1817878 RepID=A0A1F7RIR6_9BACT|nr:MAG: hypothetical protein A2161_09485 [Candidatus Schekmanbacteria bacterium RBG_13_48_7]